MMAEGNFANNNIGAVAETEASLFLVQGIGSCFWLCGHVG